MLNIVINLFSKKTDINFYSNLIDPILNSYNFDFKESILNDWIFFVFNEIKKIKSNLSIDINQIIISIDNIEIMNKNNLTKIKIIFKDLFNTKINVMDYFDLISNSMNIENGYIIYFGNSTSFVKINNFKKIKNMNLSNKRLDYLTYDFIYKKIIKYFSKTNYKSDLFIKFKNDFNINSIDDLKNNSFNIIEWLVKQSQIVQEKFIINDLKKILIPLVKYVEKKDTNIYVICDFKNNDLIFKILKRYFSNNQKCIFLI